MLLAAFGQPGLFDDFAAVPDMSAANDPVKTDIALAAQRKLNFRHHAIK